MKLAFIGLGVMGAPMAAHLQRAGHDLCVFNRTASRAQEWVARQGGRRAPTPAQAARDAELVLLCLGSELAVREGVLGLDGVLAGMAPGGLLIDHSTVSAGLAEELARACAAAGVHCLDAPVTGGEVGAQAGNLSIMLGGEAADVQRAAPVLAAYAGQQIHVGGHGDGQRCKMVNQICLAGVLQGLAEGLALAQRQGLASATVLQVLGGGSARSWQLEQRGPRMAAEQFEPGFAIELLHKDLGIGLTEAARLGLSLPMTDLVVNKLQDMMARGYGRCDTAALIRQFDKDPPAEEPQG